MRTQILRVISLCGILFRETFTSCVQDPTHQACENYLYPDSSSRENITSLCSVMPSMAGCSIDKICEDKQFNDEDATSVYCEDFSVLGDICDKDMTGMHECASYVSLCHTEGSVVTQCSDVPPIESLPLTSDLMFYVDSICGEHYMHPCEDCQDHSTCDLLRVYSELCIGMPYMTECMAHSHLCSELNSWKELCHTVDDCRPIMQMFFHFGYSDYILFENWVPCNALSYWLSIVAVFLIAVFYEGLRSFRRFCEALWRTPPKSSSKSYTDEELPDLVEETTDLIPTDIKIKPQKFRLKIDLARGTLQALDYMISLALMLIAMTFNVGLFFAIVLGIFSGSVAFGRFGFVEEDDGSCC
eukprot:NODE_794_length_1192_cov_127.640376_g753_i0.p1 GENE.NODE_794_length_1192_cov_127.640376_g753_i0~~NODE_794_length_1192_cov_127.640376_g753_i0.p1  ORF type:complete len:357 (+),score=12.61 NODE_794_length_1192_cov_127.640376_g753_i0:73-1143(+)